MSNGENEKNRDLNNHFESKLHLNTCFMSVKILEFVDFAWPNSNQNKSIRSKFLSRGLVINFWREAETVDVIGFWLDSKIFLGAVC